MISFNLCSCSIADSLQLRELGVKIRELGAGRRPAELANPPEPEPMFKDGRGRAGRLDQEPAGLEVPEDNEGGPKLGPGPGLESRPGIVKAFILALISSAFAFMFDFFEDLCVLEHTLCHQCHCNLTRKFRLI